jgi:hypothetical protein
MTTNLPLTDLEWDALAIYLAGEINDVDFWLGGTPQQHAAIDRVVRKLYRLRDMGNPDTRREA